MIYMSAEIFMQIAAEARLGFRKEILLESCSKKWSVLDSSDKIIPQKTSMLFQDWRLFINIRLMRCLE